jgi:hypothetical protein
MPRDYLVCMTDDVGVKKKYYLELEDILLLHRRTRMKLLGHLEVDDG